MLIKNEQESRFKATSRIFYLFSFLYMLLTWKIEEKQFPSRRDKEKFENAEGQFCPCRLSRVQEVSFQFLLFTV